MLQRGRFYLRTLPARGIETELRLFSFETFVEKEGRHASRVRIRDDGGVAGIAQVGVAQAGVAQIAVA